MTIKSMTIKETRYGVPLTGPLTDKQRAEVRRRLGPTISTRALKAARMRLINRVVDRIDAARMDKIPVTNGTIGRVWFLEDVRAILEDEL
jgi:hypothetical protein